MYCWHLLLNLTLNTHLLIIHVTIPDITMHKQAIYPLTLTALLCVEARKIDLLSNLKHMTALAPAARLLSLIH